MANDISVCLTFDFDAFSLWIARGETSPSVLSRGEFGRVGAERILELLDRLSIAASWYIPGHTIETFPETVSRIVAAGHEVGHHGYAHEPPARLTAEEERAVLVRGIEVIRQATGVAPSGYRSPSWDLSPHSIPLLLEHGFAYDSSLMGSDFQPYLVRVGDEAPADGPYRFGTQTALVEMPVDWSLDDWPYFTVDWRGRHVGLRDAEDAYRNWLGDFEYLRERVGSGVFILTMHPQVIGRGHRIAMLERLIEAMRTFEGVRFRRMDEVAREWAAAHPLT